MRPFHPLLAAGLAVLISLRGARAAESVEPAASAPAATPGAIAPYEPRFGRARPLVAVVGDNAGTVAADFVIPYGVLAASGLVDLVSVATRPGLLRLGALNVRPDFSVDAFDAAYPQGADYVFVPAVTDARNPALVAWVGSQANKGATMVSICNGAIVLANAGVTRDHAATGHWSTHEQRTRMFPETRWLKNVRYVADGKVVSSAGITAALPTSIAVVESIGGTGRANDLARRLGVADWSPRHDSDAFRLEAMDYVVGAKNAWLVPADVVDIEVSNDVDEIAVALASEAYQDTLRDRIRVVAKNETTVRTRGGLLLVADALQGDGPAVDFTIAPSDDMPAGGVPDQLLDDITRRYGARTARLVVLDWEYPVARR